MKHIQVKEGPNKGEIILHPENDAEEVYLEGLWMWKQLQEWGFAPGEG